MSDFTYEQSPLENPSTFIRLIKLLPPQINSPATVKSASLSAPLQCHISSVSISSVTSYTALSYTWGPPSQTHLIFISDHKFFITPSLATALEHIRHPNETVTLWIDQICINQLDFQEKSKQIPLMSQIYSQAEKVLIWLGPASNGSDILMDNFDRVGREAQAWGIGSYLTKERFPEFQRIAARSDPEDEKTIAFHGICETAASTWDLKAIAEWRRRPWFSRVWVVQEFCAGAQSVLHVGNSMLATDPRDKIFALLALANDETKLEIKIDYTNLSIEELYISTSRAIMENGDLDLLGLAQHPKADNSLPSWVPDWRGHIYQSFCCINLSSDVGYLPLFAASGCDQPSLMPTDNDKRLGVEGYLVDDIEDAGGPWYEGPTRSGNYAPYIAYLSQIKLMCKLSAAKGHPIYEDPERRDEGVWRIPIGDIEATSTHDTVRATSSFVKGYDGCLAGLEFFEQMKVMPTMAHVEKLDQQQQQEGGDVVTKYRIRMQGMVNMRPYLSNKGYVGMGPVTTQPGDIIAVFIGARVPYILRRGQQETYFLLGEAYCDGIMDGEITTKRSKQKFILA
ncbi:heterokaryon incompatibility protein-domain-containing protein [Leptodontidium sp. 2 PMI_412]|nr:heterokaryon incompatibility protein-domain-containing protein [Leptodontidium sp. 2 PMI_412]